MENQPMMASGQPYVVKSLFCESGTYQPINLRTYTSVFNNGVVDKIDKVTEGGKLLGKNTLASLASDIITPSTAPSAALTIDEGWGTQRFTFVIEIACPPLAVGSNWQSVVLTGYTNYTDVSLITKSFDPNMRLYFNSSSLINTLSTRLPNGQIHNRRVLKDSSHLLGSAVINNIVKPVQQPMGLGDRMFKDDTTWMLPKYVISEMRNIATANESWGTTPWVDFRYRANPNAVIRSRRDNAVTGNYLDRIIGSVTHELNNETSMLDDELRSLSNAAATANEVGIFEDYALALIQQRTNYLLTGYVTWAEFVSIFAMAEERTMYTLRSTSQITTGVPEANAGSVEGWNGVNYETTIANAISQLVPAIMTSSLIGNISFAFTNDNGTMEPELTILNGNSLIEGIDMAGLANNFTRKFINEVYPLISNQSRSLVSLIVHSNIGTETHISVSYENGPTVPFCAPTFCDAMYTPITSTTDTTINNIASDLHSISAMIANNHMTGYTGGLIYV